jgi:iron complex outermembrane recepter protein
MRFVTLRVPGGSMAPGLAIFCLAGASAARAQDAPVGTYHSRAVTLELTSSGQARFSNMFGPLIVASYLVVADTITFRDESGPAGCPAGPGRYLWSLNAQTLQLRPVSDPCEGRRTALSTIWTRGLPPASTAAELTPVMITAQRRTEDVQRAPVAITVLSSDVLRDARVTQPQSLTYLVPGLQIGSLPVGAALIYLRGVGNFAGTSLQDPTVTFNFDGVYIARQTATSGLFYDLERVEVLKGPQGTLYGRNATGGAVNILPRRPVLGVFGGEIGAEYGQDNTVRVDGALNLPVGERAGVRIAGQRASHNAYMTDGTDDQNDWAGRFSFRYDVNDALTLRAVADYYDQGGHGPGSTPLATGVDNRFGVSSPQGGAYYATQRVTIAGRNWLPLASIQRANNRHWGFNTTMDWRTAMGGLTVVTASRTSRLDALNTPSGNLLDVQEHSRQNSVEARLSSEPYPRLQTLAGAFYFDEDMSTFGRPHNQFNISLQRYESGVTSAAAFGRLTWNVTDRIRATGGARHTHESKYFEGSFQSVQKICLPPGATCPNAQPFPLDLQNAPIPFPPDTYMVSVPSPDGTRLVEFLVLADESAKFSRTTWRSSLEYDVSDRALLYGSYETGFKSGGFFFTNDSPLYRPESIGALTVGLKSRLFDNRVQANVEVFDWRYHDQQVSKISVDSRGATNLRTENIGQAKNRGFETDIEYLPHANTHLSAEVQYLSAIYDSYTFHTSQQPLSGCAVTTLKATPPADFLVDCSGRRSPFAPVWTQAFEAAQVLPLESASLTIQTRARHQSETLTGVDFLPEQQQPGYWMVDASLTLSTADRRRSVSIFGQNLTDETVMSNTFVVPFSTFTVGVLRPPRTIGVRVSGRF